MAANIIAFCALIATIFAAWASSRSAKGAEESAKLAYQTLNRLALREIAHAANDVVADERRIENLAEELRQGYVQLSQYHRVSNSSVEALCLAEVQNKVKLTNSLTDDAKKIVADIGSIQNASESDITQKISELDNVLSQLRPLRELLERELSELQGQNKIQQEQFNFHLQAK